MHILHRATQMFLLSTCSFTTFAEGEKHKFIDFTISPSICIVEQSKQCEFDFAFDWTHRSPTRSCLLNSTQGSSLVCMDTPAMEYSHTQNMSLVESTLFSVKDLHSESQINKEVLVQELGKDVRALKRKLWSVF
ncbi:DUF3019 domain-containing protein [Pseudoalteromonas piscicida]|uniref:DUF3019 domain-containing protein n=1 Tax=Pseudoalteromonas piscicida TaxID=43662 RepID=UPI00117B360C|nr:DUF3019 domain-containing protein [Pseudoalteromonas piscicida]